VVAVLIVVAVLTAGCGSSGRSKNVQLPAIFAIKAGGVLDPPQIAAPQRTAIELTIRSRDGRTHLFVLDTPHPYRATVQPGALTRRRLTGIPKGTYSIDVDHVRRGALIVGVAPGP
jgi:hypothetical protein